MENGKRRCSPRRPPTAPKYGRATTIEGLALIAREEILMFSVGVVTFLCIFQMITLAGFNGIWVNHKHST